MNTSENSFCYRCLYFMPPRRTFLRLKSETSLARDLVNSLGRYRFHYAQLWTAVAVTSKSFFTH